MIKAQDIEFTIAGEFSPRLTFTKMFGNIPNFYSIAFNQEGVIVNIKGITADTIDKHFPGAEWSSVIGELRAKETSAAEEINKITYSGAVTLGEWHSSSITVIDKTQHIILVFDNDSADMYYDADLVNDPGKLLSEFYLSLPTEPVDDADYPHVNLLSYDPTQGYYLVESAINRVNVDIDQNYNDDFKPVYKEIFDFLTTTERKSGIVLLNGDPGTGKTYLLRHLINKIDKDFILITPGVASNLASPEFISFMIAAKDAIFILEDCEMVIQSRKNSQIPSAVSSLLNTSDGLMSDVFNGKFVCTFNAPMQTIDDAIMRKGRCYAAYTFGKLCEEKTKNLLNSRGIILDKYEQMTLSDIYNYGVQNIQETAKPRKIGF